MSNKGGEVMGQAIKKNKVEYIDRVHGNSKGWITRSCIDENGYSQWHYKYLELKETDLTGENIYITKIPKKDIEDNNVELDPRTIERTVDMRIGIAILNTEDLLKSYKEGKIKSQKLIDIVKKMKEDSNPVIMFMNFK